MFNNKSNKSDFLLINTLFLCLFFYFQNCFGILELPTPPAPPTLEQVISKDEAKRLALVLAYIKQYYVKQVETSVLTNNAISGLLTKLDPHSDYLNEADLKDLEMLTAGKFGGIGVEIIPDQGAIRIVSPLDDTPAAKAGIKAKDVIIQINSKLVKDMTLRDAVSIMRGPRGSVVTLTILRKSSPKPLIFKIRRDVIKVQTIKSRILAPGYGYVRIAFFQDPTETELRKAIYQFKQQKNAPLKGLVLDLRNNPGGLLDSSIQVADDFIDSKSIGSNKLIVYTKGQFEGAHIVANATPGELLPNVPIVVLINDGSASAAEIVAGALQDQKRAVIVGTKSFGKGSVQTVLPLDSKSAIKLTTAIYYTPSGRSIQAKGIDPDVVVEELQIPAKEKNDSSGVLRMEESKLVDHIENGDPTQMLNIDDAKLGVISKKDNVIKDKDAIPLPESDYQLYEALNILKGLNAFPKR